MKMLLALLLIGFIQESSPKASFEVRKLSQVPVAGWTEYKHPTNGKTVYAEPQVVLNNHDVAIANSTRVADKYGNHTISIDFTEDGGKKLEVLTKAQLNKQIGFFVNNKLILAPHIQSVLTKQAVIDCKITRKELDDLLLSLNSKSK